jgi:soluble lytic murein transglycosylase
LRRGAGVFLLILVAGCGSVSVETPPESPETRSARLRASADSLCELGFYDLAAEAYAGAALVLEPGSPARMELARTAAAVCPGPNREVAVLLLEKPDSLTVFHALRLGGAFAALELRETILSRSTPYSEYAALAAAEALVDAGMHHEAAAFLSHAGENLPGAAGSDHLVLSYRVALGTGDTAAQEALRRRAGSGNEVSSALLHYRGMHRHAAGLPGWQDDLVESVALWPAGDIHGAAYEVLKETLFSDPAMASRVAEHFYGGGMWNQLNEIAVQSRNPPAHLYYLAARTRDRLGRYDEAVRMLSEYIRRWPQGADAPDAVINLARSRAALGQVDEALDLFDLYERSWPTHTRMSNLPWYRGSLLFENGLFARSVPFFRQTLAQYPGNTTADDAHFYLCLALLKTGDPTAADELARFIARWTESVYSPPARFYYGRLLHQAGNPGGRVTLETLISDKPESLPAFFARTYLGLPPFRPAYTTEPLDQWMTRNNRAPAVPPASAVTGAFLVEAGRRDWAIDLFRGAETEVGGAFRLGPFYAEHGVWERGPWAAYTMWSLEGANRPLELWRLRYPKAWGELVEPACERYGLDPLLVYSIMKQESGFSPGVYSTAGARGLLQMIPSTSEYVADQRSWEHFTPDALYDPSVSIEYGTACISGYSDEMGGGVFETLAAYNGGPHNAVRWGAGSASPEEFFARITFNETKKYVELVHHNYEIYRAIWP